MSRFFSRGLPVVALGLATLLGGCVVVPGRPYYGYGGPVVVAPAPVVAVGGWGWRRW